MDLKYDVKEFYNRRFSRSSATFWLKGIETTWFVYAILLFYIKFPTIYKIISRGTRGAFTLLFYGLYIKYCSYIFFLFRYTNIAVSHGRNCQYSLLERFPRNI